MAQAGVEMLRLPQGQAIVPRYDPNFPADIMISSPDGSVITISDDKLLILSTDSNPQTLDIPLNLNSTVVQVEVNCDSSKFCVFTHNFIRIIEVADPSQRFDLPVETYNLSSVMSIHWTPYSENHIGILLKRGKIQLYNVETKLVETEVTVSDPLSFCFGPIHNLWLKYCAIVTTNDSKILIVRSMIPKALSLGPHEFTELSLSLSPESSQKLSSAFVNSGSRKVLSSVEPPKVSMISASLSSPISQIAFLGNKIIALSSSGVVSLLRVQEFEKWEESTFYSDKLSFFSKDQNFVASKIYSEGKSAIFISSTQPPVAISANNLYRVSDKGLSLISNEANVIGVAGPPFVLLTQDGVLKNLSLATKEVFATDIESIDEEGQASYVDCMLKSHILAKADGLAKRRQELVQRQKAAFDRVEKIKEKIAQTQKNLEKISDSMKVVAKTAEVTVQKLKEKRSSKQAQAIQNEAQKLHEKAGTLKKALASNEEILLRMSHVK